MRSILIKVPSWVSHPMGKYYLYFAHHHGHFIKLAYADDLEGLWSLYLPGTLDLEKSPCRHHIASPEIIVNNSKQQIEMYYHGGNPDPLWNVPREPLWINKILNPETWGSQRTFRALSKDGLNFVSDNRVIGPNYIRLFEWNGEAYYIVMPGVFCKYNKDKKEYEYGTQLFSSAFRHCDVVVDGNNLYVFYTNAGDCPEHIICSVVTMSSAWEDWKVVDTFPFIYPEESYEGASKPLLPSKRGITPGFHKQLRDPNIFIENERAYMLYCGGGENNIVMAEIKEMVDDN